MDGTNQLGTSTCHHIKLEIELDIKPFAFILRLCKVFI